MVACNHTMQCRVEGAIGCSKQHSRVALVCANVPTRFWPDATVDFTCKKNTLWAKRDEHSDLSTANNRMQPAFAGLYKTFAIPFGSCVTEYLPREHPLVKNKSFRDRFVEGIYLRADHDTPCIRMYCITSGSELLARDFKSYPDKFRFRDPSCLLRCTPVILKDLAQMHIDDAHDDNLVAEEQLFTLIHAHRRELPMQKRSLTTPSCWQLLQMIRLKCLSTKSPLRRHMPKSPRRRRAPSLPPPTKSPFATIWQITTKLAIARAFLRHSVEYVLPPDYRPDVMGEMRIIGVDTKKLTKTKAVLIVKFLTPQSLNDSTTQKSSCEPKCGLGQGADLSILTAMNYTSSSRKVIV